MSILSIQSGVVFGHVGNRAAVFPLQRLGFEVWPIDTVQFSNHTGYGAWRGRAADPAALAELVAGLAERGVLAGCEAVLTGYLGEAAQGEVALDAVRRVKSANPRARYCCDPVLGDAGRGIYVRPGLVELFRERIVPASDIVTPNQFELELLVGARIASLADALAAAAALRARGPATVLVTSLVRAGAPADTVEMLAATAAGAWLVTTPRLDLAANGAGDLTAALFLAHLLKTDDAAAALAATASSVHAVLAATAAQGARELLLIEAQDALADPPRRFAAQRVA